MVTWMTMPEDQTEREKFLRLYGACEKRVYAAAFRVLRDPAPTEDAAQQAWLRLLQSWERVSTFGLEEACGYAVTVAKNAAIDLLRAQRHTVSFSDEWEPPAPTDSAGEYAYLVSLVRALPEGYRRVLELKLVEEQSNQEIARRLGLNESTVATRIQRGKAMRSPYIRNLGESHFGERGIAGMVYVGIGQYAAHQYDAGQRTDHHRIPECSGRRYQSLTHGVAGLCCCSNDWSRTETGLIGE